jgi:hypothetical protein
MIPTAAIKMIAARPAAPAFRLKQKSGRRSARSVPA